MNASRGQDVGGSRAATGEPRVRTALRYVEFAAIGALSAIGPAQWLIALANLLSR